MVRVGPERPWRCGACRICCAARRDALPCRPTFPGRVWSPRCPSGAAVTGQDDGAAFTRDCGTGVCVRRLRPPEHRPRLVRGLKSSAGVACCGSAECRPAAARYNERTGLWETEVIKNTWLPVPSDAFAQIPRRTATITCASTPERSAASSSRERPNASRSTAPSCLTWLTARRPSSFSHVPGDVAARAPARLADRALTDARSLPTGSAGRRDIVVQACLPIERAQAGSQAPESTGAPEQLEFRRVSGARPRTRR